MNELTEKAKYDLVSFCYLQAIIGEIEMVQRIDPYLQSLTATAEEGI